MEIIEALSEWLGTEIEVEVHPWGSCPQFTARKKKSIFPLAGFFFSQKGKTIPALGSWAQGWQKQFPLIPIYAINSSLWASEGKLAALEVGNFPQHFEPSQSINWDQLYSTSEWRKAGMKTPFIYINFFPGQENKAFKRPPAGKPTIWWNGTEIKTKNVALSELETEFIAHLQERFKNA